MAPRKKKQQDPVFFVEAPPAPPKDWPGSLILAVAGVLVFGIGAIVQQVQLSRYRSAVAYQNLELAHVTDDDTGEGHYTFLMKARVATPQEQETDKLRLEVGRLASLAKAVSEHGPIIESHMGYHLREDGTLWKTSSDGWESPVMTLAVQVTTTRKDFLARYGPHAGTGNWYLSPWVE